MSSDSPSPASAEPHPASVPVGAELAATDSPYSPVPAIRPAPHPSGDAILAAVAALGGVVGSLVNAFPGRDGVAAKPRWLEDWFEARARARFFGEAELEAVPVPVEALARATADDRPRAVTATRLVCVEPRWFRGFRHLPEPISLGPGLVLFDGRNSSGKTSLAEAVEWLFEGHLARREQGAQGNAKELEACVGNQFRPAGEETWVEAVFETEGGGRLRLKRVLEEDYGPTQTARCRSRLERDGRVLTAAQKAALLDDLFGGAPPLLMQHTLRVFVHSPPAARRGYFERLLRLDEIGFLIENAVLGQRSGELLSPTNSVALAHWTALKQALVSPRHRTGLTKLESRPPEEIADAIHGALPALAAAEFDLKTLGRPYGEARAIVEAAQRDARQRRFPLLASLRPTRAVDEALAAVFDATVLGEKLGALQKSRARQRDTRQAAKEIGNAQLAVASAIAQLTATGLIPDPLDIAITCPVCDDGSGPTLQPERVRVVRSWGPVVEAVRRADEGVAAAATDLRAHLRVLLQERRTAVPKLPEDGPWEEAVRQLEPTVAAAAATFRTAAEADAAQLAAFDRVLIAAGTALKASPLGPEALDAIEADVAEVRGALAGALAAIERYAGGLTELELAVGSQSGADPRYAARAQWLEVGDHAEAVALDLAWEQAKKAAAASLAEAREELKAVRQALLEQRRGDFNLGMDRVWSTLRGDAYSRFHELHIPPSSGRGFKVEIEVKAVLNDGAQEASVDALRVFSESQVHALGIAAFVTRAKMLGHQMLLFDDPVQSMDDEHHRTFADALLSELLEDGFQVIVLTHNESFAKELSFVHSAREAFETLRVVHGQETGSRVEAGHRRLRERLVRAEREARKGRMREAWVELRLAVERFLPLVQMRHGPADFEYSRWLGFTGEQMLKQGADVTIRAVSPKLADRMAEVVKWTAAGAHDGFVRGETDFARAVKDVRDTAKQFRIED